MRLDTDEQLIEYIEESFTYGKDDNWRKIVQEYCDEIYDNGLSDGVQCEKSNNRSDE